MVSTKSIEFLIFEKKWEGAYVTMLGKGKAVGSLPCLSCVGVLAWRPLHSLEALSLGHC